MRNLGELMLYIESIDFKDKAALKKQLEEFLAYSDEMAKKSDKPFAIIAKTIKGKGVSFMENKAEWHGSAPNKDQYEQAMQELSASCEQ